MLFKKIALASILLGAVTCYQTEDAYPYYQEPVKHHKNSLARQALDGLSSGGAALIGVVSSFNSGDFGFRSNHGMA